MKFSKIKINWHCIICFIDSLRDCKFRSDRRRRYALPGRYPSSSTARISWKLCTSPTSFSGKLRLPRIAASNSRCTAVCWCFSQLSTRPRCSILIVFFITFLLIKYDWNKWKEASFYLHSFAFYSNDQSWDCIVLPCLSDWFNFIN
jgi:hypothetical protein